MGSMTQSRILWISDAVVQTSLGVTLTLRDVHQIPNMGHNLRHNQPYLHLLALARPKLETIKGEVTMAFGSTPPHREVVLFITDKVMGLHMSEITCNIHDKYK